VKTPFFCRLALLMVCLAFPGTDALAQSVLPKVGPVTIPSGTGPLIVDGVPEEALWQAAIVLPIEPTTYGAGFPGGGETRAVVRGHYLCLSAQLPEPEEVVARSTGENPDFWREDLVVWTIHFRAFATTLRISINPLGGYRVENSPLADHLSEAVEGPGYFSSRLIEARKAKVQLAEPLLVSAAINHQSWSAEVAIPVEDIATIGFLSAERIRVPRPDAPEMRWYWPAPDPGLAFRLAPGASSLKPPALVRKDWGTLLSSTAQELTDKNPLAAQLALVPNHAWDASEQKRFDINRMWEHNLAVRVSDAAVLERQAWQKVDSPATWKRFRDVRIAALKASLGTFPERTPLRTEVTRKVDYGDGFVVDNLLYESRPGLVVTANLYLPSNIHEKIPAMVVVHSHHASKVQMELQDLGMTWARAGSAVLIMDQLGAGERIQSQPWPHESEYSRYAMGEQLYLAGESLIKWMVWDIERGVDLLLDRSYVDPKRIALVGAVAGGGDPAAVTAAIDPRIAVVIPFNFGEAGPEEHFTAGPRPYDSETADPGWGEWESTRCLPGSIHGQFFPWLINAAVAPRGFVYSFELGWPHGAVNEPIWKRYKKVFEITGQPDHLAEVDGFGPFPGPGEVENIGLQHREKLDPILNRWLNFTMSPVPYHNPRPDSDLLSLTSLAAAQRKPALATSLADGMAETRLAHIRQVRNALDTSERLRSLRALLKEKLGDIDPNLEAPTHQLWTKQFSGFTVEAASVDTAPDIHIPLFILKPTAVSNRRLPIVLSFAKEGKEAFLKERRDEIAALLEKGEAICLADVRGTGETAPTSTDSPNSDSTTSATSLAATELMLGATALGERLKDARTVARYLGSRNDLDTRRVVLWGDSFAQTNPREGLLDQSVPQKPGPQTIRQSDPLGSLLAVLTALYEDNVHAVVARGSLASYLSVLQNRFCYVPQDVIVPGLLESADVSDILAALAPRAVLLEGPVDGRNRPLTEAEAELQLRPGFDASEAMWTGIAIRPNLPAAEFARWIDKQLSR